MQSDLIFLTSLLLLPLCLFALSFPFAVSYTHLDVYKRQEHDLHSRQQKTYKLQSYTCTFKRLYSGDLNLANKSCLIFKAKFTEELAKYVLLVKYTLILLQDRLT